MSQDEPSPTHHSNQSMRKTHMMWSALSQKPTSSLQRPPHFQRLRKLPAALTWSSWRRPIPERVIIKDCTMSPLATITNNCDKSHQLIYRLMRFWVHQLSCFDSSLHKLMSTLLLILFAYTLCFETLITIKCLESWSNTLNKFKRNALLHYAGGSFLATLLADVTLERHIFRKLLFMQWLEVRHFLTLRIIHFYCFSE
jgi:hypothetical protein